MGTADGLTAAKLAAMQRALMNADDKEVLLALQYVDTLTARGPADALVAPLRERLTGLRPSRAWRLPRLLFTPLNAVLVSRDSWRPGTPRLPRPAIPSLAEAVRAALPQPCAAAEAMLTRAGKATPDVVTAAGTLVWPHAGAALLSAAMPPNWCDHGLPAASFRPLANTVAFGLDAACRLPGLAGTSVPPATADTEMAALLNAAEAEGPVAWGVMLVFALQYLPRAEPTRQAVSPHQDPVWQVAAQAAVSAAWRWIEAAASAVDDPADHLLRRIELLDVLGSDPAQHHRGLALRAKLRVASARLLERSVQEQLIAPLQHIKATSGTQQRAVEALTAAARAWRKYDAVARRLDGPARLDMIWRDASDAIRRSAALSSADREFLIDVMASPPA